jgi:adenylosuccinate lyase
MSTPQIEPLSNLLNLTPLDGRYQSKVNTLSAIFSEYALIRYRVKVEIEWLIHLSACPEITELPEFSPQTTQFLRDIIIDFCPEEAQKVKIIESTTNHDVKAVEYYLREKCQTHQELTAIAEFWHFACTSEDINNLSYALMLKEGTQLLRNKLDQVIDKFADMAKNYSAISMLSRTHGQSASPTTMGKEMANIGYRLYRQREQLLQQTYLGKINGAVGNYNAHLIAYPAIDWQTINQQFICSLGIESNPYTTQIEPHDYCAELAHIELRLNTILIDACRDIWGYISLGYFGQKTKEGEVGSSTMPHKVNPIDFENAEGNLGLANALLNFMAEKLPISRWQRDLSDSTVQRNWGSVYGYMFIALQSLLKGLDKLKVNHQSLSEDLNANPEVLAEAIQTVMRKYHIADSYDTIKNHTRGKRLDNEQIQKIITELTIPDEEKHNLQKITASNYIGNASQQAEDFYTLWQQAK